jgi:YVTN family beta-propeller protein
VTTTTEFVPLSQTLPYWPSDILGQPSFLDEIGVSDFDIIEAPDALSVSGTLLWFREITFEVPGLSGVSIALLAQGGHTAVPFEVDIAPSLELRLPNLTFSFRIASDLLRPVELVGGKWVERSNVDGEPVPAEIVCSGVGLRIAADGDIAVTMPSGAPKLSLPPVQIGDTGLVVEIVDLSPYLARGQALLPGMPPGFRGFAVKQIKLHLPDGFDVPLAPNSLQFKDVIIGTGGFSAKVSGTWNPVFNSATKKYDQDGGEIFGVAFGLKSIHFDFKQNVPVRAEIEGEMYLPFFEKRVNVEISLGMDGGLSVALSANQPDGGSGAGLTLIKEGLLSMTLDSIRFEIDHGVLTIRLAGKITPLVGGLTWPAFDIDELSIDTEGHVSLTGGWVDLPQGYTLNLFAFKLEITKFGAGRDDNGNQYLGFNGALDLVKGIPAGASVEGLRITWSDSIWPPQLSVKGVGVELTIPDKLHFKGEVSYEELGDLKAFTGAITLELPAVNGLAIDGKIVFGSTKDPLTGNRFKYFGIYLQGEFGTGIPLWASGLALNGIAGLFAVNYGPDKPSDWAWYSMDKSKSWFHKPPIGVTDIIKKWAPQRDTWAIGAGASISTYADGGHLFNGKFLLLLVFPGPVFMIDGRGNFLEKPSADKEPLFHSLVVLDVKAGYFLIGLDAQWKYDKEGGKLVQIAGSAETFFNFNDPSDWHIYIGKDTPMEQRIRASFAGGMQANAYFMLDPRALRLGVWIGKNEHYKFGPVSADMEAWLDANATLSFRPPHLGVSIWLHGLLGVKVLRWKFAIGLDARLEADVAKPFHILGSMAIKIETRFKTFEFDVRLEWGPRPERPAIPDAFPKSGVAHLKSTVEWPLLADGNGTDKGPTVPLDARPYFMFEQPVHDGTGISVNPSPDPGWIVIGDRNTNKGAARVRYELKGISLERRKSDSSPWQAYPHKLYGAWAAAPPNPANGGTQNRFMLYAKTPFDLTDDTDSWNPWAASNLPNYPCPVVTDETICVDWKAHPPGTGVNSPWIDPKQSGITVGWDGDTRPIRSMLTHHGIWFGPIEKARGWLGLIANQSDDSVSVIDTARDVLVGVPIKVGKEPFGVVITPEGTRALVNNLGDGTVSVIDIATRTVVGEPIRVRSQPYEIAITPDGRKAYVPSAAEGFVSVIDVAAARVVREIAIPDSGLRQLAILPNGLKAYVFDLGTGVLRVIDVATDTVRSTTIRPGVAGAGRMLISRDGKLAYISGVGSDTVAVLDTATDTLVGAPFPVGAFPIDVTITPDGTRLYAADGTANTVSVIDLASRTIIATVPVGDRPLGIAITPDGAEVYVTNTWGNSVTVISTKTNQVIGSALAVRPGPEWIAFSGRLPAPPVVAPPPDVLIDVPAGTATVEVLLYQPAGRVTGEVVDPPVSAAPVAVKGAPNVPLTLRLDAATLGMKKSIRRIRLRSESEWLLARVCITRPVLEGGFDELTKLHDELAIGLSVWGAPGAVLEPYTDYRLTAEVQRTVAGMGELAGWDDPPQVFKHSRRFHTDGPPGLVVPTTPPPADGTKNTTGLEDLTRYVVQTIPVTLAPEGERPELQKPVYRAYDIGVAFNEDYVDRMYELSGRDLAIRLHDVDDEPVRGVRGGLIAFANRWGNAAAVTLTETRLQWIEVLNAASCLPRDVDVTKLPKNKTLAAGDHVLGPDTLYEARLVPLLLRAPVPGGDGWTSETLAPGVTMRRLASAGGVNPDGTIAAGVVKPNAWTDVLIQVTVRPMTTGLTGVAFRIGASTRYVFAIDAALGKRSLSGVAGPKRESAFAYDPNKTYDLSIEAIGARLRIEQDGELVFEVENDSKAPTGTIGLFPWLASGPQRFQNLSVHDFRKGAPVAYRFPFTTSRYVDFFHQVQAHTGETWSGTLPATYPASAIVPAIDLTAAAPEPEARAYDELARAVLGSAASQLPPRLEVTRVQQGSALYALLIRGDEPLDWRRTTLTVTKTPAAAPAIVPGGRMKIADATFGGAQPVDTVSVLLHEPLDLTGSRIEARMPPRPLAEPLGAATFADKFAQNDLTGWTLVDEIPTVATSASSAWSTVAGELRLRNLVTAGVSPSYLGTFAATGPATWADIALSARVRCPGGGAVGLVMRGGGVDDYYRFSMDSKAGYRQLVRKNGGAFTVLWRDAIAYDPSRTYELTLIATGDVLRGFIDGVPLFAVRDATRPAGLIALYVWNGEAYFSDVRVDDASRAADEWLLNERFELGPSERWTFVTEGDPLAGAWQSLNEELVVPDLVSSGVALAGDVAWTDYRASTRMLPGATGATALLVRHQTNARCYHFRWEPLLGRLRFIRMLGTVGTVLWQGAWSPATATETLLTVDCIGSTFTGYVNGAPLFSLKDDSVPSGRVGFWALKKTGTRLRELRVAAPVWEPWYSFDQERLRDAGTRVEIRREPAPTNLPALEPGMLRKFNPRAARLPKHGVALRVVDAERNVVQARHFLPPDVFSAIGVRLMRSADSTAFVLLPATGGSLTPGTYRLSFKYERTKAGVTPDLSRGGSNAAETATIDVSVT